MKKLLFITSIVLGLIDQNNFAMQGPLKKARIDTEEIEDYNLFATLPDELLVMIFNNIAPKLVHHEPNSDEMRYDYDLRQSSDQAKETLKNICRLMLVNHRFDTLINCTPRARRFYNYFKPKPTIESLPNELLLIIIDKMIPQNRIYDRNKYSVNLFESNLSEIINDSSSLEQIKEILKNVYPLKSVNHKFNSLFDDNVLSRCIAGKITSEESTQQLKDILPPFLTVLRNALEIPNKIYTAIETSNIDELKKLLPYVDIEYRKCVLI